MARKKIGIFWVVVLLMFSTAAWAQQKGSIELKSAAEVEVVEKNANGEKTVKRMDAAKAKVIPGDVVIFTTSYSNIGKEPATAVVIKNPVPQHTVYVDKTAEGKGTRIEFSADGGKTYGAEKLTVKDSGGKVRKAMPSDYTHIKWIVAKPVPPGGKGSVSFKAKLK